MKPIPRKLVLFGALILLAISISVWLFSFSEENHPNHSAKEQGTVWTCSMHPQIRLPYPGKCPICEMPLIKVSKEAARPEQESKLDSPTITLSEHARAMAGIETVAVDPKSLEQTIRAVGKVQPNERSLATVITRVDGYVERLFVDYTGVAINKGDHLVEVYSPDLVVAQQELLLARGANDSTAADSTRLKLLRLGLTEQQIADFLATGKTADRVTFYSPVGGTVLEKTVVLNSPVKAGDVLYRVADLSSIWVYLDIYEYEIGSVQTGREVELHSEAFPKEKITGRVWFISPVLNEETRTVKVLVNVDNRHLSLKPGMYVSAHIRVPLLSDGSPAPTGVEGKHTCPMHPHLILDQGGKCPICNMDLVQIPPVPHAEHKSHEILAIPTTTVLDGGNRKLVFVERRPGEFAAVEVTIGSRAGDWYPVLSGLNEGDRVATRGNFLLDSQMQVSGLPSLFYPGGQSASAGHKHGEYGATSKKNELAPPAASGHRH